MGLEEKTLRVSNLMNPFPSIRSVSGGAHVTWSMTQRERARVRALPARGAPAAQPGALSAACPEGLVAKCVHYESERTGFPSQLLIAAYFLHL